MCFSSPHLGGLKQFIRIDCCAKLLMTKRGKLNIGYVWICCHIYSLPVILWNICKAQWQPSYLTFWWAGYGYVPTTNTIWRKMSFAMSEIKDTKKNAQKFVLFFIIRLTVPTTARISIIICWIYEHCVDIQQLVAGITHNLRPVAS